MLYLRLMIEFFKTGLFAIGGGLATLPFLYELSEKTGWFTTTDISNMIAISESTPGPIGINMSTYVGYHTAGLLGGIVTTLSLVLPSIIIIEIISKVLTKFKESKVVKSVFYGIRPASTGLIAAAGLGVFKVAFLATSGTFVFAGINLLAAGIGAVIFILLRTVKLHPLVYIAIAAALGVILKL